MNAVEHAASAYIELEQVPDTCSWDPLITEEAEKIAQETHSPDQYANWVAAQKIVAKEVEDVLIGGTVTNYHGKPLQNYTPEQQLSFCLKTVVYQRRQKGNDNQS